MADASLQIYLRQKPPRARRRFNRVEIIESRTLDSFARTNAAQRARFEYEYQSMLEIERALKIFPNNVRLLYRLLAFRKDPTSDIVAALEGLRIVLDTKGTDNVA